MYTELLAETGVLGLGAFMWMICANLSRLIRRAGALAELESKLSEINLTRWLTLEDSTVPEVFLPRFRLEGGGNLRKTFEALGIKTAFLSGEADFSEMVSTGQLNLEDVIHRNAIEVDEAGGPPAPKPPRMARFASKKESSGSQNNLDESRPVFRADRPFLFLIRDTQTGAIALIGRVVQPEPFAGNRAIEESTPDSDTAP
jgi:serpin B